jgi:thiol-disulfide isomerase/thioredoxin
MLLSRSNGENKVFKPWTLSLPIATSVIFIATDMAAGIAESNDLNKGVELYNAGKYSQSLPLLEAAVRTSPYDASGHYYLGLCYQALKQNSLARPHFEWVAKNARDLTLRSYAEKAVGSFIAPRATGSGISSTGGAQPTTQSAQAIQPAAASNSESQSKQLGRCKVLMFETSWCHYCHEFAPQFDEAAEKYRKDMDFQHVDAEDSANLEMKQKYGIKSYPRLVYLDGKGNLLYNEGRGGFTDRLKELTGK